MTVSDPILNRAQFIEWAREVSQHTEASFWRTDQYRAEVTLEGKTSKPPAFLWDLAVQLSALAKAASVDPKLATPLLERASKSLDTYWSGTGRTGGYSVLPGLDPPDRFYDDDAWVALAMQEAFQATKDPAYLARAKRALTFSVSGEDRQLGGGVFWRENEKLSKNTCSNAPTALACLIQGDLTHDVDWRKRGLAILDWTGRLEDKDGLFFDNVNLKGKVDQTKWTYNTALMIRAWCYLAKHDGNKVALAKAIKSGHSAMLHWVNADGQLKDEASFAHHMVDAFLDLSELDPKGPWLVTATKATAVARNLCRGSSGLFGLRWDRKPGEETKAYKLLYQASMERALWSVSAVLPTK